MTIHLPPDIESSIQAAVRNGHFVSVDAAMAEAASLLLQKLNLGQPAKSSRRDIAKQLLCSDKRLSSSDHINHLRNTIDLFLGEVAEELHNIVNVDIKKRDCTSYGDKKEIVKEINAQAAYLGLAIRCPKTGLPSFLVADSTSNPKVGRFQFRAMDATSGRHRTLNSIELPELTFIPALDRRNRSASWVAKVDEGSVKNRFR